MTQEEYRALKEGKEPETPQAPEMDVIDPETSTDLNQEPPQLSQQKNDGGDPIQPPPQQVKPVENEMAEYRRKYQESEGKIGLLQQQLDWQNKQMQTLQQQMQVPVNTQPQEEAIPEFEDPKDLARWLDQKYERKFEQQKASFIEQVKMSQQQQVAQQTAQRIIDAYPDMNDSSSPLYQQFARECYQRGIDPNNPDPFTLEAASAIAAAKVGVLPKSFSQQTPNLPQPSRPNQFPGIQRMAPPAPPQPAYNLSARQQRWAEALSIDPSKVTSFMKKNASKYVKADGTPLYGRRSQ